MGVITNPSSLSLSHSIKTIMMLCIINNVQCTSVLQNIMFIQYLLHSVFIDKKNRMKTELCTKTHIKHENTI